MMMSDVASGILNPRSFKGWRKPTALEGSAGTIGEFFDVYGGQRELHNKENLTPGHTLVISSSGTDCGAYGFFEFSSPLESPFASIPGTGSIGQGFVQEWPCGVTDHCYILVPKKGVPPELLYVACATIRRELWRFSYGAQITPRRIEWFPLPNDAETIKAVRFQLAVAARIEKVALGEAEDEIDRDVAKQRLTEIVAHPESILEGNALEAKLKEWES
jgi:hypothetical protein